MIVFYVDGSCRPTNPGPGAFGVLEIFIDNDGSEKILSSHYEHFDYTTNNQMELAAINWIMQYYSHNICDSWGCIPVVYSDSAYAVNTLNEWMFNWANNNWKKSDKKTPENLEIIQEYYNKYNEGYRIDLRKVKGHSINKWNNLVDALASGEIKEEDLYGS